MAADAAIANFRVLYPCSSWGKEATFSAESRSGCEKKVLSDGDFLCHFAAPSLTNGRWEKVEKAFKLIGRPRRRVRASAGCGAAGLHGLQTAYFFGRKLCRRYLRI